MYGAYYCYCCCSYSYCCCLLLLILLLTLSSSLLFRASESYSVQIWIPVRSYARRPQLSLLPSSSPPRRVKAFRLRRLSAYSSLPLIDPTRASLSCRIEANSSSRASFKEPRALLETRVGMPNTPFAPAVAEGLEGRLRGSDANEMSTDGRRLQVFGNCKAGVTAPFVSRTCAYSLCCNKSKCVTRLHRQLASSLSTSGDRRPLPRWQPSWVLLFCVTFTKVQGFQQKLGALLRGWRMVCE